MDNKKPIDRIGDVYGVMEIISIRYDGPKGNKIYHCKCKECGYESNYSLGMLKRNPQCRHVQTRNWRSRRLSHIFSGMKTRCNNSNDDSYKEYGAKGIRICDEWMNDSEKFENWAYKNGYDENTPFGKLTIDRIDSTGNYCPENCRWVTLENNAKFKSTTRTIEVDGEIYTGRDWALKLGLGTNVINTYIRKYGEDATKDFIRKVQEDPLKIKLRKSHQTYYDLYMN